MTDAQTIGAISIGALAVVGFNVPEIPLPAMILAAAIIGSLQATFYRLREGTLRGLWSFCWVFIAGVTAGMWVGDGIAVVSGLHGSKAEILPVYLVSLFGAKLVVAVIEMDVGKWLLSILTLVFDIARAKFGPK